MKSIKITPQLLYIKKKVEKEKERSSKIRAHAKRKEEKKDPKSDLESSTAGKS